MDGLGTWVELLGETRSVSTVRLAAPVPGAVGSIFTTLRGEPMVE